MFKRDNSTVKVQFKFEKDKVYAWVEKYGLTVSGCDKECALHKVEMALKHMANHLDRYPE